MGSQRGKAAMVDRLVEKTGPEVQLESAAQTKGERTRERILDIAYESIVEKGFAATSIEELVEAAGITKSGFFYHFRDKNDMARQLFDRFLSEDEKIIETLEQRARELSDDPLQSLLIFLNLYAQMMDDMETLHPGCMVASVTYQERLFDSEMKRMNVDYLLRTRQRFADWLNEIVELHPPKSSVAKTISRRSSRPRSKAAIWPVKLASASSAPISLSAPATTRSARSSTAWKRTASPH